MKTATRQPSTYRQFVDHVNSSHVQNVTLKSDRLEYALKTEWGRELYTAKLLNSSQIEELTRFLKDNNIQYTTISDNAAMTEGFMGLLLATGLLAGTLVGLKKMSNGGRNLGVGFGVGKSKARVYSQDEKGRITFTDVAGVDEAKQELAEVVDFLADSEKYRKVGAKIPKGILLVGSPGTGKTLLAKAVAGEAGVPFISMSGSEFVEVYVGVGASRVRDLFNRAKRQAPCIIFIDELDAVGKTRSSQPNGGNDEREQTLNQLLTEMDGFTGNDGVIVIAATNRPEMLDPALRRPGRFDRQVLVDRPDKSGRLEILQVHSRTVALGEDVNLERIADLTFGFVGADLANLVNEAALMAARENRQVVLMTDFKEAIERVVAGLEKRSRILTSLERQIVAYHEVGHALVGALMEGRGKVSKISIVPRGASALGYTLQMPQEDRFLMLEDELRGQLAMLLGGRAAEELIFGKVSTGASDDIQKATELAERAVTQYGMSQTLGPVAFDKNSTQFLEDSRTRRTISEAVAAEIDRQVKDNIHYAYRMALDILALNRDLLKSTTQFLLENEVLEGDELQQILTQVQTPVALKDWLEQGVSL